MQNYHLWNAEKKSGNFDPIKTWNNSICKTVKSQKKLLSILKICPNCFANKILRFFKCFFSKFPQVGVNINLIPHMPWLLPWVTKRTSPCDLVFHASVGITIQWPQKISTEETGSYLFLGNWPQKERRCQQKMIHTFLLLWFSLFSVKKRGI